MKAGPLALKLILAFGLAAAPPLAIVAAHQALGWPFTAASYVALAGALGLALGIGALVARRLLTDLRRLEERLVDGLARIEARQPARTGPAPRDDRTPLSFAREIDRLAAKIASAAVFLAQQDPHAEDVLQDELAKQKQQLEAFLRGIGDGVSIVDPQMRIIYVNDAIREVFGDHVGERCYSVYEHKSETCAGCPVQKAMETGEIHHSLRRVYDKHGNLFFYESTGSPIRDETGRITAGLELARDVTEKIKLERNVEIRSRQLAAANAQLRQANEQLQAAYEDLKKAQIQLVHSEKMASLGVLVAGVAHEINNPLNFVSASVKLLNQHWRTIAELIAAIDGLPLPPDARSAAEQVMRDMEWDFLQQDVEKMIKSIATGAERMAQIVQNLRTFSRLDAGRREDVDVREGIESTLQILHHKYKDRIAIERDYQTVPTIYGNPGQLNQVFMNILHNAIQAIDGKGAIRITTRVVRDQFRVSIADTGVGIGTDDLQHVFDPFFTTKKVGEGTGLGLSISYGIVQDHGGRLWVESEKGKGSVFHIDLPLPPPKEMAKGA